MINEAERLMGKPAPDIYDSIDSEENILGTSAPAKTMKKRLKKHRVAYLERKDNEISFSLRTV